MKVFEAKQIWLDQVMASKLSPATKVFAFGIWQAMYGDKVTSHPGSKDLEARTGLHKSKFSQHRTALFACKALTGVLEKHVDGDFANYTYTLNLNWDGSIPKGDTQEVTRVVPTGVQGGTQRVTRVVPTGSTNTSRQDINEDINGKTSKKATAVAGAPALPNNIREDGKGMNIEDFSCVREDDVLEVMNEGVTYYLTTEGVTKMEFEGTYPLLSNIKGSAITYTLPKEDSGISKSEALVKKKLAELAQKSADQRERAGSHLENLITKEGMNEAQDAQAREWFSDSEWEPARTGTHRASWAVLQASLLDTSDGILVEW